MHEIIADADTTRYLVHTLAGFWDKWGVTAEWQKAQFFFSHQRATGKNSPSIIGAILIARAKSYQIIAW